MLRLPYTPPPYLCSVALRLPWWSLRAPFADVAATAALPFPADRVMYLLSEEAAAASSATVNKFNYKEPKTAKQVSQNAIGGWWLGGANATIPHPERTAICLILRKAKPSFTWWLLHIANVNLRKAGLQVT